MTAWFRRKPVPTKEEDDAMLRLANRLSWGICGVSVYGEDTVSPDDVMRLARAYVALRKERPDPSGGRADTGGQP